MVNKLSDMVARIKNSQARGALEVLIERSKLCVLVLECLVKEGYIRGYVLKDRQIEVLLKYKHGWPVIKEITCISRPGFRRYYKASSLRKQYFLKEKIIFTNSTGVFLNNKTILSGNLGGEALIKII